MQAIEKNEALRRIENSIIDGLTHLNIGITEGAVRSVVPPYRRLDCDLRALAYIRVRSKLNHVRVDVSGLWIAAESKLIVRGANGCALFVATPEEAGEAIRFLVATVEKTRASKLAERVSRPLEVAKLPGFESPIQQLMRDPTSTESLRMLLELVCFDVPAAELDRRSRRERAHAELFAARTHLSASGNVVRIPPMPEWLKPFEQTHEQAMGAR